MDSHTQKSKTLLSTFLHGLKCTILRLPNRAALLGIRLYRVILSPSVGILRYLPFYPRHACIFYPTCSQYGVEAFKKYPFFTAVRKTMNRIGRCHPGNEPRVDLP